MYCVELRPFNKNMIFEIKKTSFEVEYTTNT